MSSIEACGEQEVQTTVRMRGDERREQLIRVALTLFSKKGFNGTTTKEIAATAGVTEALIFRHFPSKEALYQAILVWRMQESDHEGVLASLRSLGETRNDELLIRTLISNILSFHRANPEFQRLMLYTGLEGHTLADDFRERFIRPIHEYMADYITMRQREGAFRDLDPRAVVRAIISIPVHHSLTTNLFRCSILEEISDEHAVDQFTKIILNGLRRTDGAETSEKRSR